MLLYGGAFSSCREQKLLSNCGVQPSHCTGFSCCGTWAVWCLGFSSCSLRAPEHRLSTRGTQAYLPCSMCDLFRPGIKPLSLALQSRLLMIRPPRKPWCKILDLHSFSLNIFTVSSHCLPILWALMRN